MTDLVKDLRIIADNNGPSECAWAADEIERLTVKADTLQFLVNQRDIDIDGLRRDNARLRETLRWIADDGLSCGDYTACKLEAAAALAGTTVQPNPAIEPDTIRDTCPECYGIGRHKMSCSRLGAKGPTMTADRTPAGDTNTALNRLTVGD